jgi:hypothetical protein
MAIVLWSFSFVRLARGSLLAAFITIAAVLSQAYILAFDESIIAPHRIVFVAAPQILWSVIVRLLLIGREV